MIDLLILAQGIPFQPVAAAPVSEQVTLVSPVSPGTLPSFPTLLPPNPHGEMLPLYGSWLENVPQTVLTQGIDRPTQHPATNPAQDPAPPFSAPSGSAPSEFTGSESISPDSQPPEFSPTDPTNPTDPEETNPTPRDPSRNTSSSPNSDLQALGVLDLVADQQEYDRTRQWVSARGRVYLRFNQGALRSDRLDINLQTQVLRATGNVQFQRGRQRLAGEELEYNLMQETGTIEAVWGEVDSLSTGEDFKFDQALSTDSSWVSGPPSDVRLQGGIRIESGFGLGIGSNRNDNLNTTQFPVEVKAFRQEGTVRHWRFQSSHLELMPDGWVAERARLTNDPINPPQFQIRTRRLQYRELGPLLSEVRADRPRFVFDNVVTLPTFRRRVLLDRRPQDAGLFTIGFDNEDRGGLYIERAFEPISSDRLRVTVTPQLLLQNAFSQEGGNLFSPKAWGVKTNFAANLRPGTQVNGAFTIPQLDSVGSEEFENDFRANIRGSQTLPYGHRLNLEYSYRDRLFNGSLGFQTVQQTLGVVVQSPQFQLGSTGIVGDYQLGAQWINADTDRLALLNPIRKNSRVDLGRYQFTAALYRGISLWQGKPLSDPERAIRYTPTAIVPGISLGLSTRGIYGVYSNGDTQEALIGSVGIYGTFGHFSRPWFDYTQLTAAYSQALRGRQSPFLFDRIEDSQVLSLGFTQQLYGPIRFGMDTGINLVTGEEISTNYRVEYSRRAFSANLNYNPVLGVGAINFRINDFLWNGVGGPLDAP